MSFIREDVIVKVMENDDAVVRLHIDRDTGGAVAPVDFTGAEQITFLFKKGKDTPDSDAYGTYTLTGGQVFVVGDPTNGDLSVVTSKLDNRTGSHRYKVILRKAGRDETIMAGPYVVENT